MLKLKYTYVNGENLELKFKEGATFNIDFDQTENKLHIAVKSKEVTYEEKVAYYQGFKQYRLNKEKEVEKVELFSDDILLFNSVDMGLNYVTLFLRDNEPEDNEETQIINHTVNFYAEFEY